MRPPEPGGVLVVGVGLIGRAIVRELSPNRRVTALDRDPATADLLPATVGFLCGPPPEGAPEGDHDVVVWAAGVLSPALGEDTGRADVEETTFAAFLDSLEPALPRQLVLISSLGVYGGKAGPSETDPVAPASGYGRHKAAVEEIARTWAEANGVVLVVLRCCGVVGPVAEPGGGWMQDALRAFIVGGAKDASRLDRVRGQELLLAADVARCVSLVLDHETGVVGVFNVGSGVVLPVAPGAPVPNGLDWAKARHQLGYEPRHDTIKEIMQAMMNQPPHPSDDADAVPGGRTLILAGSHRTSSYSTALAQAVAQVLRGHGQVVDLLEIATLDLPMHDPADHRDPEGSPKAEVRDFAHLVSLATSFVWVTPIYHGTFSAGLKNALDNVNIPLMDGKPVAVMSHGGGRFGGSVLEHLRTVVVNLHGQVVNVAVATNNEDFEETDAGPVLRSEVIRARLERVADELFAAERAEKE